MKKFGSKIGGFGKKVASSGGISLGGDGDDGDGDGGDS